METKLDLVTNLLREGHITPNQSRILLGGIYSKNESYYVVEVNGRYYENETVLYSDNEIFEHSVRTTKSLLECKRFYSEADAQETADKHGFLVRKVRVECE